MVPGTITKQKAFFLHDHSKTVLDLFCFEGEYMGGVGDPLHPFIEHQDPGEVVSRTVVVDKVNEEVEVVVEEEPAGRAADVLEESGRFDFMMEDEARVNFPTDLEGVPLVHNPERVRAIHGFDEYPVLLASPHVLAVCGREHGFYGR